MKTLRPLACLVFFVCALFVARLGWCSDISVSNISLGAPNLQSGNASISFNVSWTHSWRTSSPPNNWDAAWVFLKYRVNGGAFAHVRLNESGHSVPSNAAITVGLADTSLPFNVSTNPGVGAFIFRRDAGSGPFTASGVSLSWNYAAHGISPTDSVDIEVFAIEMVYVPQGPFYAGDHATSTASLRQGSSDSDPWFIDREDSFSTTNSPGNGAGSGLMERIYYHSTTTNADTEGQAYAVPTAFPKGFAPFYVMKGHISQAQWVRFFNTLTPAQRAARDSTADKGDSLTFRNNVSRTSADATLPTQPGGATYASVGMSYLSWGDVAAFLDWAGLRPMSELEFEKAARGPLTPIAGEYAWGTTTSVQGTVISNGGLSTERAEGGANITYGDHAGIQGPLRSGSFGTGVNSRQDAGAGYYGAMDLSGTLWDRAVTVGNPAGRSFVGARHGDGQLTAGGDANATSWPLTSGDGAGYRGGSWYDPVASARVSDREGAARISTARDNRSGGRGARSAFGASIPASTPTPLATATPTPTFTSTSTPTDTPTFTPTDTPLGTPTDTPTETPTATPSDTPTSTPTDTPTDTPTPAPTNTPTSTPTITPTSTPYPTLGPSSLHSGLSGYPGSGIYVLADDVTLTQSGATSNSTDLSLQSGRAYSLNVLKNGDLVSVSSCTNTNGYVFNSAVSGALILDIPEASTQRSETLSCVTSAGSVTLNLTLRVSTQWHVSSSARVSVQPSVRIMTAGVSKDAKIVAYTVQGGFGTGHSQIVVKNLETGVATIASSRDGTLATAGNGDSTNWVSGGQRFMVNTGVLSEDGRYVLFLSTASNLVTGVTSGTHIYRKDLNNPSAPPIVVNSLDSSQPNQTGYLLTGSNTNPSMSWNGRYVVWETTATNVYTGTNGWRWIAHKDLDNPAVPPKIASSLDHSKAAQSGVGGTWNDSGGVARNYIQGGNLRNATVSNDGRYVQYRGDGFTYYMPSMSATWSVVRRDMTRNIDNATDWADPAKNPFVLLSSTNPVGLSQSSRALANTATAVLSNDGRYVLMPGSDGILLASGGAAVQQAISFDLNSLNGGDYTTAIAPKVISSLDPSQNPQTNYYFNGASGSLQTDFVISPDGRYSFFGTAFGVGANFQNLPAATQIMVWDRNSPDAAPKVVTSLDSSQTDQSAVAGNNNFHVFNFAHEAKKVFFRSSSDRFISGAGEWATGQEMYLKNLDTPADAPQRVQPLHSALFVQRESHGNGITNARISGNGRYVVWSEVGAMNFFQGLDAASSHVYMKDLENPLAPIRIVSSTNPDATVQTGIAFDGTHGVQGIDISDDGSVVVFTSTTTSSSIASNLTGRQVIACRPLTGGNPCVVVSSTDTAATNQTGLISAGSVVSAPRISGDGSYVVWLDSTSSYGYTGIATAQLFGRSLASENAAVGPKILSSIDPASANQTSKLSSAAVTAGIVNSNGTKVAFTTAGTNLCTGCGVAGRTQVYLGTVGGSTFQMLSSADPSAADQTSARGSGNASAALAWSGNDRYVVFLSASTNFGSYTNLGAAAQLYRVDLDNLGTAPKLVSTKDDTLSDQTGLVSTTAINANLAISNDGDRVYFATATQNYLASTTGINRNRPWEKRMSTNALTLMAHRGGDVNDVANLYSVSDCYSFGNNSKGATFKIGILCSGHDHTPGLTNKSNFFVKSVN